jgi:MYXO-CTERM domain-containing protein
MSLLALTAAACLATSNGYSVAAYDAGAAKVSSLRPHLYAAPDATSETPELMRGLHFGLRAGGTNRWLDGAPVDQLDYLGDTGIIRVVQRHGDLVATQYFFAAFGGQLPHLVAIADVVNDGSAAQTDGALFLLADLAVGTSESLAWRRGAFEESGSAGMVVHLPIGETPVHAVDPRGAVADGGRLSDVDGAGPAADLAVGFEWDLTGLAPGEHRMVGAIIAIDEAGDRSAIDAALVPVARQPAALLDDEEAGWQQFFERVIEPPGMSTDERAVYRQSLALLRMAQVREPGPPNGQIVAGLAAGRTWARDQAAAVRALVRAGLHDEARRALEFVLAGTVGVYEDELAEPYGVSVLRYRGDGSEESDLVDGRPVIGVDGFGHTLVAIADYVRATGDQQLVDDNAQRIFDRTAGVITRWVDIDDTFLLRADNSIWNGAREKHTYSQATVIWGLCAAAELSPERAADYRDVAGVFASALERNLVDGDQLSASLERPAAVDGAAIEAFNRGVLPGDGAIAHATLDAIDVRLALPRGGLRRDELADDRESHLIDLWVATAAQRAGRDGRARELIDRVTEAARAEGDLVPDRYGDGPAVGLGAGAYVVALWDRSEAGAGDGGCGCRTGRRPPVTALALLLLVALVAVGRRR